jgi:hypothetical protein
LHLQDHVLPALQDQHKAAVACTCSALRVLVQQRVTALKLLAGQCCRVHDDRLAGKLPAVSSLCLQPGNLHEAMFVLPIFFMQVSCGHLNGSVHTWLSTAGSSSSSSSNSSSKEDDCHC